MKDFSVSTLGSNRGIEFVLLSERAADPEAQKLRIRRGRRVYDHFVIEMSDEVAKRVYEMLHRKYERQEVERSDQADLAEVQP